VFKRFVGDFEIRLPGDRLSNVAGHTPNKKAMNIYTSGKVIDHHPASLYE
jgi:hypothetical protein